MIKSIRSILGVTLLEIMLVLAIAAMVIVLSIRYYQTAANSSQANTIMGSFQSITAAADNLSQGVGSYLNVSQTQLLTQIPLATFTSPWGSPLTYVGASTSFTVAVTNPPEGVCALILPKLGSNTHTATSKCDSSGLSYVYIANP